MNKEKTEKAALIIILVMGLMYAYYTYLFSPKLEVSQKVKGQLVERQKHHNQLVSFEQNMYDLEKTIESMSSEANDLSAQIPPRLDNPQIMVDIYNSAKLYGVDPTTLHFEQLQNKGSYQAVGMTFTCSGNVDDVLTMISAFGYTALQKLSVQSVTLTAQKVSSPINTNQTAGPIGYQEAVMDSAQILPEEFSENDNYDYPDSGDQLDEYFSTSSSDLYSTQLVVTAQIKLTAYASPLGTANVNGPNPIFMSAKFGVSSAAEMFK